MIEQGYVPQKTAPKQPRPLPNFDSANENKPLTNQTPVTFATDSNLVEGISSFDTQLQIPDVNVSNERDNEENVLQQMIKTMNNWRYSGIQAMSPKALLEEITSNVPNWHPSLNFINSLLKNKPDIFMHVGTKSPLKKPTQFYSLVGECDTDKLTSYLEANEIAPILLSKRTTRETTQNKDSAAPLLPLSSSNSHHLIGEHLDFSPEIINTAPVLPIPDVAPWSDTDLQVVELMVSTLSRWREFGVMAVTIKEIQDKVNDVPQVSDYTYGRIRNIVEKHHLFKNVGAAPTNQFGRESIHYALVDADFDIKSIERFLSDKKKTFRKGKPNETQGGYFGVQFDYQERNEESEEEARKEKENQENAEIDQENEQEEEENEENDQEDEEEERKKPKKQPQSITVSVGAKKPRGRPRKKKKQNTKEEEEPKPKGKPNYKEWSSDEDKIPKKRGRPRKDKPISLDRIILSNSNPKNAKDTINLNEFDVVETEKGNGEIEEGELKWKENSTKKGRGRPRKTEKKEKKDERIPVESNDENEDAHKIVKLSRNLESIVKVAKQLQENGVEEYTIDVLWGKMLSFPEYEKIGRSSVVSALKDSNRFKKVAKLRAAVGRGRPVDLFSLKEM